MNTNQHIERAMAASIARYGEVNQEYVIGWLAGKLEMAEKQIGYLVEMAKSLCIHAQERPKERQEERHEPES